MKISLSVSGRSVALASLLGACGVPAVRAADVGITAVPTAWRLQNYIGTSGVVLWYTGSTCSNGLLTLTGATEVDRNRFWSLILSAKATGRAVIIYYDNASANCPITSFGMDG